MKALMKSQPGTAMTLAEVPEPAPGPNEVLIRVKAVGVCGTDLHILHDEYPHAAPLIPGHELCGELVGIGSGVEGWKTGDRVVAELHTGACRDCEICASGNPQICPQKRAYGTWVNGAFAEFIALPVWLLHRPPETVSDDEATLFEPTACSVHGLLERGNFKPGNSVVVAGHGPIGLLSAQVALAAGASAVLVAGTSRRGTVRIEAGRRLGFEVVDVEVENLEDKVNKMTDGRGVDIAVEAAGAEPALAQAIQIVRPGGRVTVLGLSGHPTVAFPWDRALVKDLDVTFSFSSKSSSWRHSIEMGRKGDLALKEMITHRLSLDCWEEGFNALESGSAVKVVLHP